MSKVRNNIFSSEALVSRKSNLKICPIRIRGNNSELKMFKLYFLRNKTVDELMLHHVLYLRFCLSIFPFGQESVEPIRAYRTTFRTQFSQQ